MSCPFAGTLRSAKPAEPIGHDRSRLILALAQAVITIDEAQGDGTGNGRRLPLQFGGRGERVRDGPRRTGRAPASRESGMSGADRACRADAVDNSPRRAPGPRGLRPRPSSTCGHRRIGRRRRSGPSRRPAARPVRQPPRPRWRCTRPVDRCAAYRRLAKETRPVPPPCPWLTPPRRWRATRSARVPHWLPESARVRLVAFWAWRPSWPNPTGTSVSPTAQPAIGYDRSRRHERR